MKRPTRILIGAAAAITTFASLVALVGMRHGHIRKGFHYNQHCSEHCEKQQEPAKNPTIPMHNPAGKTADTNIEVSK